MSKEFYDKYGKEFHCGDCSYLEHCIKSEEPLLNSCREEFLSCKVSDLEAKLAESKKRVKDLEFSNKNLEHLLKVAPNANAGQRARIVELKEINHKLKQQLAEKDKTIEILKNLKADEMALKVIQKANQDKISFCIEKLEKVKENLLYDKNFYFSNWQQEISEVFDNQIKQLKEMK